MKRRKDRSGPLEKFSRGATRATGSSAAFAIAILTIVAWAAAGPIFGFSDTWQLVINTSTTIITFLMVFLIQRAQNKDSQAIHLKLNEIVAALPGTSNRLIDAESLSEKELEVLHAHYQKLASMTANQASLQESHSVEEAVKRSEQKSTGSVKAVRRA